MLSACYSFQGPTPVIKNGNVVTATAATTGAAISNERFRRATLEASGCRFEPPPLGTVNSVPEISTVCDPEDLDENEAKRRIDEFLRSGYALIYADCGAYFDHMGARQRGSRLTRDTLGPIGDLISGIISIVRFENSRTRDDLQALLALGSQTSTAALNVYDQNLLFGADNICVVRQLIQRALSTHASATFDVTRDTFGQAANHLDDNQAICRPPRILTLVRTAIAAGGVQPRASSRGNGEVTSVSVSIPQAAGTQMDGGGGDDSKSTMTTMTTRAAVAASSTRIERLDRTVL